MVARVIIAIVCLTGSLGFSQDIQESIPWSADYRLSWKDFKGPIPLEALAAATTASGISYEYSGNMMFNEVKIDFVVTAFFYPQESWYKPDICDDNTLSHEQLHFDIAELFARRMRKKLSNATFSSNVKEEVRNIYQETLKELSDLQERYDWETDYSRNREVQLRWNQQIAEALELMGSD